MSGHENPSVLQPVGQVFRQMGLSESAQTVPDALGAVRIDGHVIEDYRPLSDSLEWKLAATYWEQTGLSPFVENSVPYLVNNNGRPSENAAAVFITACLERDQPDAPSTVVELGAGSGLFARYFLDAVRMLCEQRSLAIYDTLTYVVTDHSRRTVEQWAERNLFGDHAERVLLATCDACRPDTLTALDGSRPALQAPMFVIGNYLLDVLPASVIRPHGSGIEELHVRTRLSTAHGDANAQPLIDKDRLRALVALDDDSSRKELISMMSSFEFETAWRPASTSPSAHVAEALESCKGSERIVLNYGAMDALDAWTKVLAEEGCIFVRDYGQVVAEEVASSASPQRFGKTIAMGLNFLLLEHHVRALGFKMLAPVGDAERGIHVRLICRGRSSELEHEFSERFGALAEEYAEQPFLAALEHSRTGRHEDALECFKTAVERNPRNWFIIGSAAEFVCTQLRDFDSARDLAQAAIELNPYFSSWLWNVLGDCVFCLRRFDSAHEAYLQASRIDVDDPRTNLNLAYTYQERGDARMALQSIATGLTHDRDASFRERLLEKQLQILTTLSLRTRSEHERLMKRALAFS